MMPTPTPFTLTPPSTIIVQVSPSLDVWIVSPAVAVLEKENSARKSDKAWALIALRGTNLRSKPRSLMDHSAFFRTGPSYERSTLMDGLCRWR